MSNATNPPASSASAAAAAERSTAMTRSKSPSTASASAMHPHPVPMSATAPHVSPFPFPVSRMARSTRSTSPSVSGRGISARASSVRSSVRKPVRPTAYAKGTPLARRSTARQNRSTSPAAGSWSRCSPTSPGLVAAPATAAHSMVASRREVGRPEAARRWAASSSTSRTEAPCAMRSRTEPLLLTCDPQGVDQIVEVAVQHLREVVNRVMDAVVGHAILGEVVGTDFLRSVTGTHLGAALAGPGGFLLGDHLIEQARAQHLECPDLVLQLALLVLALNHEIRGQVGDAHGAVGRVDALAARSLRAEDVDPEVLVFDLHVDLLRFGKHRHRRGRRVLAPLPFRDRYALHPVDARFVPQRPVDTGAPGGEDGLLQAPEIPLRERDDFDLPAPPLAEPRVHAKQLGGEQRRLIASRAGTDLHDRIAVIEGVRGGEQVGEPALESLDLGVQPVNVRAGQLRQLGIPVLEHFARLGELPLEPVQPVVRLTDLVEPCVLAAQLPELGRIPRGLGVGQLLGDLLRPRERLAESGLHALACGLLGPVFLAETLHPPGRIHQLLLAGEVRVALGADLDMNHGHGGTRDEVVAARALHGGPPIDGVNPRFHCTRSLTRSRTAPSVEI